MAARGMGYRVRVVDPDPECPARFVVDECIEAGWDDTHEAANLARGCDVVTLEIEQVALASLDAAARYAPVRPDSKVLGVIQDRIVQKNWLRDHGFPVGEFRSVSTLDELRAAIAEVGPRCFCKSATGGYDGRGQGKVGFTKNAPSAVSNGPFLGEYVTSIVSSSGKSAPEAGQSAENETVSVTGHAIPQEEILGA